MKYFIGRALVFLGGRLINLGNFFRLSESNKKWFRDRGNETHRLKYDELTKESLVLDLGGYEGQWASDIFSKYQCRIWIFEVVPDQVLLIRERFKRNPNIRLFDFGLSSGQRRIRLSVNQDRSSTMIKGKHVVEGVVMDVAAFFEEHNLQHIDLMKINIEGGEYDLLDRMIETGLIHRIDNLQIQFHDFFPEAEHRMQRIQKHLEQTHSLTYQYYFIFENWKRRSTS